MLGALAQAIIVKLHQLYTRNLGFRLYRTRADRREQVARGALGHRRQADRLRQARRSADARSRARAARVRRRRGRRAAEPRGGRVRAHGAARRARAPIGSWRSISETGDLKAVVRHIVERDARRRRSARREASMSATQRSDARRAAVGREYSFPPAFIERVNELGAPHGITAEMVKFGGTKMDEPARYRVIVDRISHEVEYYRGALKHAVLQGTLRHQQPVLVDGRRQVLQLLGHGASSGARSRGRCCCRRRAIRRTSTSRRSRCATWATRSTGTGCSTTSAGRRS